MVALILFSVAKLLYLIWSMPSSDLSFEATLFKGIVFAKVPAAGNLYSMICLITIAG